jgi:hypothetical protein
MIGPIPGYSMKPSYRTPRPLEGTQTANHTNNTVPGTAALSNTVPSYATLGGKFLFASAVGAETDYALFGYQVPSTHRFICTGVRISAAVAVALTTTATLLEWALGLGSTAASLATADADPVFGPRILPLGSQGFVASAAVGIAAPDILCLFDSELVVEASRYVHAIVREPVGAATGTFRGAVTFDGWFEPTDNTFKG